MQLAMIRFYEKNKPKSNCWPDVSAIKTHLTKINYSSMFLYWVFLYFFFKKLKVYKNICTD